MRYIDEAKIEGLIEGAQKVPDGTFDVILAKAKSLQRLALEETAALLCTQDEKQVFQILEAASFVKDAIYGRRVVLFAPLYISNICQNNCLYCAFRARNTQVSRKALSQDEIREQIEWLLKRGHKRILMVAGESASGSHGADYYVESIKTIYAAAIGPHRIKRVNINCAPLSVDDFKKLKKAGIGTFQIFQETYHEATYRTMHPSGPKSDPDNRLAAIERAFAAGIDDVGIGALFGLYDWRFEVLAMLMHVEHLEKTFNVGPHTISVPRLEPATGSDVALHPPHKVSDADFRKIVAVLRLSVPYTGIILSTRESPAMRDELFNLGVSQVSAESRTSPGGYDSSEGEGDSDTQFTVSDHRSLDEVVASLIAKGFMPSFCAACYRKSRTGEAFMDLAKPGTIKGKCSMNALITLKEYLDDFASPEVRRSGYQLIRRMEQSLDNKEKACLGKFFTDIDRGVRDDYV
ncbi:MAG: [FeFe] hydrogenase H-cluster radical SAM maturase HydG [Candidatus Omnitrophica bacterium]|nr:[FeFe] hydrogenase H-cluster radical SAM maturase HydG [Candidatus Omnitrophota bacterium]